MIDAVNTDVHELAAGEGNPACLRTPLENPYRLASLFEMLKLIGADLVTLWKGLEELKLGWVLGGTDLPRADELAGTLGELSRVSTAIGWKDLASQCARLLKKAHDPELDDGAKQALTEDLSEAFEDKLRGLHLVAITEAESGFYTNAVLHLCGSQLHPDLAVSEEELNLGGKAMAAGLSTASVSHAMRSVEASLHVLSSALGISFPGKIELQSWKVLTDKIRSVISAAEQQKRTAETASHLKYLAELLVPADGFRLAWRNHVAHGRERYETEQSIEILTHVAQFLKRLSVTLQASDDDEELPTRKPQ